MACDYLAIQGSSMPSKRAFSRGGLTGTTFCNHLEMKIFEALQLLKSAYWNGHVVATEEAAHHLDALIESLDVTENGEEENDDM
jgi:hypothetical protein